MAGEGVWDVIGCIIYIGHGDGKAHEQAFGEGSLLYHTEKSRQDVQTGHRKG